MADEPYTPTDEEVRSIYRRGIATQEPYLSPRDGHAEFDRWLAAHDARVQAEAWDAALEKIEQDNSLCWTPPNPYRSTKEGSTP